jgi:hypothetical protein
MDDSIVRGTLQLNRPSQNSVLHDGSQFIDQLEFDEVQELTQMMSLQQHQSSVQLDSKNSGSSGKKTLGSFKTVTSTDSHEAKKLDETSLALLDQATKVSALCKVESYL